MLRADVSSSVLAAVRRVIPGTQSAALHEPEFRGREWKYVKSCLDEGWVSSVGSFVDRFERELARALGRRHAIACVNGTAALHLSLRLAGVKPGDEVLVPSLTFVATANAVHYCGAIPHFVDCTEKTLGICPEALERHLAQIAGVSNDGGYINRETGRVLRALVPVHIFGHPAQMPELCAVADKYGIAVIEDATEALGSLSDGRPVGRHGMMSVLSFNGNKVVTTGGGGAVICDDDELAAHCKHLSATAKQPHAWEFIHDEVGYNYRLPNINAALGCAQLEKLSEFVTRKRRLAAAYAREFEDVKGVSFFRERPNTQSCYWLNAILLEPGLEHQRDPLLQHLNDAGLQSRPAWRPMHQLAYQQDCPAAPLPVTEAIYRRLINLPSSPKLADGLPA
jgi:perosamine synthetase